MTLPSSISLSALCASTLLLCSGPALAQAQPAPEKVTLDDAVTRALARNPTARTAYEQVKQVAAQMEEVRAQSLPTLGANLSYTRIDHNRKEEGQVILSANELTGALALNVPLISARTWAAWSRAVDLIDVQRANETDVRRMLAVTTARAYITVQTQRKLLNINQLARDNAKAHLDYAQKRLEGGVGNRIDAVRAGQQLYTDETNVQSAQAQLVRAQEALGVLLGVDGPADAIERDTQIAVPLSLDNAVDASRNRTDVKLNAQRVRAADRSLNLSYTDYLPSLAGLAEYIYTNPATLTQPTWGWEAQLALVIPLYDGGLRYGLTHERRAQLAIAQLGLEASKRQAESDARGAYVSLVAADAAMEAAKQAAKLGAQALSLADLAYRAGATTDIEVIDAQQLARDAQSQAALAEDNDLQARLDLLDAAGLFPNADLLKAQSK